MAEDAFARFRRLRGITSTHPPAPDKPFALLCLLREMHVTLRPDGNRLYVDITAGNVTPVLLAALREHTTALHALVEIFEERAAIAAYCGGLSREDAERFAWRLLQEIEEGLCV